MAVVRPARHAQNLPGKLTRIGAGESGVLADNQFSITTPDAGTRDIPSEILRRKFHHFEIIRRKINLSCAAFMEKRKIFRFV